MTTWHGNCRSIVDGEVKTNEQNRCTHKFWKKKLRVHNFLSEVVLKSHTFWVDPDLSCEMKIIPQEKRYCKNHHKNKGTDTAWGQCFSQDNFSDTSKNQGLALPTSICHIRRYFPVSIFFYAMSMTPNNFNGALPKQNNLNISYNKEKHYSVNICCHHSFLTKQNEHN